MACVVSGEAETLEPLRRRIVRREQALAIVATKDPFFETRFDGLLRGVLALPSVWPGVKRRE